MDQQADGTNLMKGLLAHLKMEAEQYGVSAPTPFKPCSGKSRLVNDVNASERSPAEDRELVVMNNNAVESRDAAVATIMGCKIRQAGMKQSATPFPISASDSPMEYDQYTSMARASLIDDLSDSGKRFTPKKLIYTDSPCKSVEDTPSKAFSFDVEGCCTMLDAVDLHTMPGTPHISSKAPYDEKESPAQMESSPAPSHCSTQDLQDLSNMLVQERAEKFALAAQNAELEGQLEALKKQLGRA